MFAALNVLDGSVIGQCKARHRHQEFLAFLKRIDAAVPAVLQRFVRLDATRSTPGSGLGLSLVDAVAKLHGAELVLTDNRPGLKVSLAFPAFHELRAQKAAA